MNTIIQIGKDPHGGQAKGSIVSPLGICPCILATCYKDSQKVVTHDRKKEQTDMHPSLLDVRIRTEGLGCKVLFPHDLDEDGRGNDDQGDDQE